MALAHRLEVFEAAGDAALLGELVAALTPDFQRFNKWLAYGHCGGDHPARKKGIARVGKHVLVRPEAGLRSEPLVPAIHERRAEGTPCAKRCPNVYTGSKLLKAQGGISL
jgi:hypothetical protein